MCRSKKKSRYFKNFVFACAVGTGIEVALLAFGFGFSDALKWLIILFFFLLVVLFSKSLFRINPSDLIDGVWAGLVLFVWGQVLTLPWFEHSLQSLRN